MEQDNIAVWVGIVTGLGTIIGWVFKANNDIHKEIDDIKVNMAGNALKIDTCWQFVLDNAKLATVKKGLGTMNTPLRINENAIAVFERAGWIRKLKEFAKEVKTEGDTELGIEIARRFRDDMIKDICIPFGFESGECVAIAVEIVKVLRQE
jgi:hypothetical protein